MPILLLQILFLVKDDQFISKKLHKGGIFIISAGTYMIRKTKTAKLFCCGHVSYETSPHCKLLLFIESDYLFFPRSINLLLLSIYYPHSWLQTCVYFRGYSRSTWPESLNENLMIGACVTSQRTSRNYQD